MTFAQLYSRLIMEGEVLKHNTRKDFIYPDARQPLKDTQVIRVYHAFNDFKDCYRALKVGISGKDRVARRYSYENNNNPKGLFVSINPQTVKDFGNYVIEFHAPVKDLEAPVWPGGSYTVQGQMEQFFSSEEEREQARLKAREQAKKEKYESISKADRPELANSIYFSHEEQALFTGDLNANSIRAVWVNKTPEMSGKYSTYERMKPIEFLKKFKDQFKFERYDHQEKKNVPGYDDHVTASRLFKPRDKVTLKGLFEAVRKEHGGVSDSLTDEYLIDVFKNNPDYLRRYLWPDQAKSVQKELDLINPN
jgi:hypothetical protein